MGVLAGWAYRKAVVINATADAAMTNYQMKVVLVKGAGADTPGTIYLNSHCLNWPTDILFTLSDGTTTVGADFWREESDATDGSWWLEANSIPLGGTFNGYIYYGKIDAADASNGDNTFLFFDHFDNGTTLDTDKWQGDTASAAVLSSICTLTGAAAALKELASKVAAVGNCRMRCLAQLENFDYSQLLFSEYPLVDDFLLIMHNSGDANHSTWSSYKNPALAGTYSNAAIGFGAFHLFDLCRLTSGTPRVRGFYDNVQAGSDYTTYVTAVDLYAMIRTYGATDAKLDWVFQSNYTTNEPTWGNTGAEEALGGGSVAIRNKFLSYRREHVKRMVFHKRLLLK